MATATEELSHIGMLAHAVALDPVGAPPSYQERLASDSVINAVLAT